MADHLWTIIVAAGAGRRLRGEAPKQFLPLGGKPLLAHSVDCFARYADAGRLILVVPSGEEERTRALLGACDAMPRIVTGGATRQESVRRGLEAVEEKDACVAVHDAARPLFDGSRLESWRRTLAAMGEKGALVPVLPVADTVLRASEGVAGELLDRRELSLVQTPQLFALPLLRRAHEAALARGEKNASDDGGLILALGEKLRTVPGDPGNIKITTREDWMRAEERLAGASKIRTGFGFDSHRFDPERPLILGGVELPSEKGGLSGHSDADVLSHAIMDAMLGAAALGDIGVHFPDTDPRYEGADSLELLGRVKGMLDERRCKLLHLDATIVAETPRLSPHIPAMREKLARTLATDTDRVSIKATTNEGMGALGRGEGMAAMALVTLEDSS